MELELQCHQLHDAKSRTWSSRRPNVYYFDSLDVLRFTGAGLKLLQSLRKNFVENIWGNSGICTCTIMYAIILF